PCLLDPIRALRSKPRTSWLTVNTTGTGGETMNKEGILAATRASHPREEGPPPDWYDEAEVALGLAEHEALTALRRLPPVHAWQVFCEAHNPPDPLEKMAQEVARLQALYVITDDACCGAKAETLGGALAALQLSFHLPRR